MAKMHGAGAPARSRAALRPRLALFPPSRQRVSLPGGAVAALAVVLASVATLVRLAGTRPLDTLYAEDGKIFLSQKLAASGLDTWAKGYNGYLHVVARMVASATSPFDLDRAPAVFAISSAVIVSLLALLVFWASDGYIRSTPVRVLLAVSVIALPAAQTEVYDNAANLHWYLIFATFWVLLWNPERTWELAVGSGVAVLAGFSDPLTVLLLPIVALRLVALGFGKRQVPLMALVGALVGQFVGMALSTSDRPFAEYASVVKLPAWLVFHVGGRALLGTEILGEQAPVSLGIAVLATLAMGVLVWYGVRPLSSRRAQAALLAALTSAAFYLASVFLTGATAPRYEALPILLLYGALALGFDGIVEHVRSGPIRVLAVAVGVVVIAVWCIDFRFSAPRGHGPTWNVALDRAARHCEATGDRNVRVGITPADGSWWVSLSCSRVLDAAER